MVIFLSFALNMCSDSEQQHLRLSPRQTTRGRAGLKGLRKPLSTIHTLWEQLICHHHYEPLISWPAPVFGGPGVWWAPPLPCRLHTTVHPQELRRGQGIPIHPGWSTEQQLEEKAAAMRARKKRSVYRVPFVLLTTSSLVFHSHVNTIES